MGSPRARKGGWRGLGVVAAALLVWVRAMADPPAPTGAVASTAASESAVATEPGLPGEELDRMLATLGDAQVERRREAAAAVSGLGREAVDAIARKLAQLRTSSDEGAASLLRGLRERTVREPSFDLLQALVSETPDPPRRRALAMECMLRALANAGTTPAIRQLVAAASDLAGALRPEISRLVKRLGERAVPALIESRRDPLPEVRSWGAALLESLGKRSPGDAVHTKDDQLLEDVLRAYGDVSDMEALPVVLSFANSDRVKVRAAARAATLAYGQDAVWRLREAYAVLLGEQAPEGTPAADLAKRLFDAYDRYRLRDVYALVDKGLALQREGKTDEAVAAFDEALASEPLLDRRGEMVAAYARRGESLEAADTAAAIACLRKALRLDEAGPLSRHVRSEILRLEGEALLTQGIEDATPFEQAVTLDAMNQAARADLQRIRAKPDHGGGRSWRLIAAGLVFALAVAGVVVLGGRKR